MDMPSSSPPPPPEDAFAQEEIMWEGRFITAKKRGRWEYVGRARGIHAAVILAVEEGDDGRHVLLVDQYRVPLGRRCLELPAGLVGDDHDGEHAADAAARELEEETGYRPAAMASLGEFFSSPGMVSESFTLFRATGLVRIGPGGGVEGEDIIVHRVPLDGVADHIARLRDEGYAMDVKLLILLGAGFLA
jgi:ADP-ribose pyrophosphatase